MKWKPIKTAPMDRTPIILCSNEWCKGGIVACGFYMVSLDRWSVYWIPTHWMHLPKAPKITNKKGINP